MQTTAKDLFDLYKAGRDLPDANTFRPTPEAPIIEVHLGEIDGKPAYAYGVQTSFTGITGSLDRYGKPTGFMTNVTVHSCDWYFDREEALRHANLALFESSEEGRELMWEDLPAGLTADDVNNIHSETVTPVVGEPFTVYRVIAFTGMIVAGHWKLCLTDDLCETLHASIYTCDEGFSQQRVPHSGSDVSLTVPIPQIADRIVGICPHCQVKLHTFGAITIDHGGRRTGNWYKDQDAAHAARDHSETYRLELIADQKQREEKKAAQRMATDAFSAANTLNFSRRLTRYRFISGAWTP